MTLAYQEQMAMLPTKLLVDLAPHPQQIRALHIMSQYCHGRGDETMVTASQLLAPFLEAFPALARLTFMDISIRRKRYPSCCPIYTYFLRRPIWIWDPLVSERWEFFRSTLFSPVCKPYHCGYRVASIDTTRTCWDRVIQVGELEHIPSFDKQ